MLSENARKLVDYNRYDIEIFQGVIPAGLARPRVWQAPLIWYNGDFEDFGDLGGPNAHAIAARRELLLFRLLTRSPAASARRGVGG